MWKQFADTIPWRDTEELTDDELAWLYMQQQIDGGLQLCDPCDAFGWHTFCGDCGQRFHGRDKRWRVCPGCKAKGTTEYCSLCGTLVAGEFLRRLEKGLVDWKAECRAVAKTHHGILARLPARLRAEVLPDFGAEAPDPVRAVKEVFGGG